MSTEWATEKWEHEQTEISSGEVYEVMTVDTQTHVGYVVSAEVAAHICEIHNRTLGDGQDPPPSVAFETARRALEEMAPGRRIEVNRPRGHLPMDLQRTAAGSPFVVVPILEVRGVREYIEERCHRAVAEYAAREPARLVIDSNPVAMANALTMLGWQVFGPDDPVIAPDHLEQIKAMRLNLAQDEAEHVPGAREAARWFDSTQLDAEKPVDNARRAFLAGYGQGRRSNAANTNTDVLSEILRARGYQVTPRLGGE